MKIKFQSRERRSGRQRRRWNRIEFQKKNNNNNNKKHQKQKEILRFEKTEIQGQPVKMTGKLRGETTTKKKKKRKWKCATRTVKCASLTWTTHARAKLFFVFFCVSSFVFPRFVSSGFSVQRRRLEWKASLVATNSNHSSSNNNNNKNNSNNSSNNNQISPIGRRWPGAQSRETHRNVDVDVVEREWPTSRRPISLLLPFFRKLERDCEKREREKKPELKLFFKCFT